MSKITSSPDDEKPVIDQAAVLDFFEARAKKVATLGSTRAVIYQDKSEDLAERRDAVEKSLLYPVLELGSEDRVLDAGCGTGRWAEILIPNCNSYHGVDVSPGLIQVAEERFRAASNARFSVCPLEKISLPAIGAIESFTRIISFGVYIYLNDDAALNALHCMGQVAAPQARIVLREPIAVTNRLTLKEHFSDEMDQYYNAIYRTEAELLEMVDATLIKAGFRLRASGDVYSDSALNNRVETKQKWFVLTRN